MVIDDLTLFTGDFTEISTGRAKVFGELVKLATPHVTAYHSDLYHDAVWLHENMCGDRFGFFWSYNASGTTIGLSALGLREFAFRVTVTIVNGKIVMSAEQVRPADVSK